MSGSSEAGAGPTARILNGLSQLREILVLSTVVSVSFLAPWRIVVFAHEAVGALLPLDGKVAVGQVVSVKALVAANVGGVEDL